MDAYVFSARMVVDNLVLQHAASQQAVQQHVQQALAQQIQQQYQQAVSSAAPSYNTPASYTPAYACSQCGSTSGWCGCGTGTAITVSGSSNTLLWNAVWWDTDSADTDWIPLNDPSKVRIDGGVREVTLPDGTKILLDAQGNYRIEDKDTKVTYQAHRNRDFNPFVNAGDLVARFIKYVQQVVPTVRRQDIGELPLALFVDWLVIEAAERDGDPIPSGVERVPESHRLVARVRPRCRYPRCQRFLPRRMVDAGFNHCTPEHEAAHRVLLAA
jgi:hypothetical protein